MKAILACEKNGGIGFEGSMPWPKQEKDLARFKELTLNTTVLMGRGTWESTGMPKPLPNRKNIVVSSSSLFVKAPEEGVTVIDNTNPETIASLGVDWVIGGAKLIEDVWDQIDEFHLSRLRHEYECDTFLNLTRLQNDFRLSRDQICLTHNYQIWMRKE